MRILALTRTRALAGTRAPTVGGLSYLPITHHQNSLIKLRNADVVRYDTSGKEPLLAKA